MTAMACADSDKGAMGSNGGRDLSANTAVGGSPAPRETVSPAANGGENQSAGQHENVVLNSDEDQVDSLVQDGSEVSAMARTSAIDEAGGHSHGRIDYPMAGVTTETDPMNRGGVTVSRSAVAGTEADGESSARGDSEPEGGSETPGNSADLDNADGTGGEASSAGMEDGTTGSGNITRTQTPQAGVDSGAENRPQDDAESDIGGTPSTSSGFGTVGSPSGGAMEVTSINNGGESEAHRSEAGMEVHGGGGARGGGGHQTAADAPAPGGASQDNAPLGATCHGYATRYWDCCKAHCGWSGNVPDGVSPVSSCTQNDVPHIQDYDVTSSCDALAPNSAFTCFSMAPRAISPTLSYGFAAVPGNQDICGRCYELTFTGTGQYSADDPGSQRLAGKRMIVQATNIGHDVAGGQFDILIPGGGVGLFDACTQQWGVDDSSQLGAQYGGFLTTCQQNHGHDDLDTLKACVRSRCETIFDSPHFADLKTGCLWFIDWYEAADNPKLAYREVVCPADLVDDSGVDRRVLNDILACEDNETDSTECTCDCSWTNEGASCGDSDGSCCWNTCCGQVEPADCECDCDWTNSGANCGEDDFSCCWGVCCGD